jgi:hypothetical protein
VIAADISPVMTNVTAVMPHVAPVCPQVFSIVPNVAFLLTCRFVVSVAHVFSQSTPVLPDVSLVAANISSVLSPVNSVVSQVATRRALTQRKCRSQNCKHQQTNDSSSHTPSVASGPDWPLGRLNTGVAGKFWV